MPGVGELRTPPPIFTFVVRSGKTPSSGNFPEHSLKSFWPEAATVSRHQKPIRTPLILDLYEKYLDNQDSVAFVEQVSGHYAQGTLQRLALSGMREIRRAAVLALGFLGDYESNHTLGRAMLDEDRNVRTLAENGLRSIWCRMGSEKTAAKSPLSPASTTPGNSRK